MGIKDRHALGQMVEDARGRAFGKSRACRATACSDDRSSANNGRSRALIQQPPNGDSRATVHSPGGRGRPEAAGCATAFRASGRDRLGQGRAGDARQPRPADFGQGAQFGQKLLQPAVVGHGHHQPPWPAGPGRQGQPQQFMGTLAR